MPSNKPIKVIKKADKQEIATDPKIVLKSLKVEFKRRMRSLEAEMTRKMELILLTLK